MRGSSQPLTLRAGPLTVRFEPTSAMLRYVRLGEVEVLRGVYAAVRDCNWDTIAPAVSDLSVNQTADAFAVSFEVRCARNEIEFYWRGTIEGDRDGTIVYRMSGEARSDFLRNRISLCVLHPIRECAGGPCAVEHVDGRVTHGVFPREISPHQPFKEIRSIRHQVRQGVEAQVTFAGEVFEMEDQRNWTDASFKTYGTPLALPFPLEVRRGERVEQSVALALVGYGQDAARTAFRAPGRTGSAPRIEFAAQRLPPVGLCVASHGRTPSLREIERLRALGLSHLRVELRLRDNEWRQALETAARQAESLNVPLDLAITLSDAAAEELARLAEVIAKLRPSVSHVFVFHEREKSTRATWVEMARTRLGATVRGLSPAGRADPTPAGTAGPTFAGGTNAYFAELNRGRPDVGVIDAVGYSVNPQVHGSDDTSVMETLEAQGATVRSAKQFCGGKPVCVGPITLRPRFNPNATGAQAPPAPGELPPDVDPRQCELFTAAWTLGSVCELAVAGGTRLTYFETTGWRGVMETEDGPPQPEKFSSVAGGVYPVYHVLADVGELAGGEVALLEFGRPLAVRGAVLRKAAEYGPQRYRLLVCNVSDSVQRVKLPPLEGSRGVALRCRTMDDRTVELAVREPERFREQAAVDLVESTLELRPYAYLCLDVLGADSP